MYKSSILRVAVAAMIVSAVPVVGQELPASLSLDEGLVLFERNSPELQLARSHLASALGEVRQAKAFTNPTASFTNEDLGGYSERYLNLSQPLDILWAGGIRGRRATAQAETAYAEFRADSARLALGFKEAFVDAWRMAQEVAALATVESVVEEVVEDASVRFAAGDLAGYDLRRLRVVRASIARRLMRTEISLADAERKLGSLVSEDGAVSRVRPDTPQMELPADAGELDASERALLHRPELVAARSRSVALEAEANLARRSLLAGSAITGGFKHQSDGQEGLFIGLELPIPFLDRRSGAAEAAHAAVDGSRTEAELVRRAIQRDAALALSRFVSMTRQQTLLREDDTGEQLLDIARVAYAEGEVGIVELIDASEAFLEAHLMNTSIRAETWLAYFQLEHAMGGLPDTTQEGGAQ